MLLLILWMITGGFRYARIVPEKKLVVKIQKGGRFYILKPSHCIKCHKVAILLNGNAPYCVKCYKEIVYVSEKTSKKIARTMRENR